MLAQHEWPEANRKRGRDDDYEDITSGGTLGFTEHRNKRLQSLPLRVSPPSKRWCAPPTVPISQPSFFNNDSHPPLPHTITPQDSDSEEAAAAAFQQHQNAASHHHNSLWSSSPADIPQNYAPTAETTPEDADMMMDISSPPPQHCEHLQPGPAQPDPIHPPAPGTVAGRMPTPIHCSFAAQVRSGTNNWGGAAGNVTLQSGMNPGMSNGIGLGLGSGLGTNDGFRTTSQMDPRSSSGGGGFTDASVPRSLDDAVAATAAVMADWSMVQNRRLPSPISESGDEDDDDDVLGSPLGMVLDASDRFHPLLRMPPRANSAMDLGAARQREGLPPRADTPLVGAMAEGEAFGGAGGMMVDGGEAAQAAGPKKGHARSRHTLNSWTLQPGLKRSFSIGYRADCEKCRMKVPGHFNHIIIS